MKATIEKDAVRLGREGQALYDQSGYGRPDEGGVRLSPEEALYLVYRGKIEIPGYDPDRLLAELTRAPGFFRRFLVYRDIRERGYVVQTGPHDFRVFRRGERPGKGQSKYMVRVLSERDLIDFGVLVREVGTSSQMRKLHLLAVVDDENELTYYEVKVQNLHEAGRPKVPRPILHAELIGHVAVVPSTESGRTDDVFGMRLDDSRLVLSSLETLWLLQNELIILKQEGQGIDADQFFAIAARDDFEIAEKSAVYGNLKERGFVPKTGYKFGHHFRVYAGGNLHSKMLVHAIAQSAAMPMSTISRSVRLAHSVKKKMLFGCVHNTGIQYIEFARVKL
ncbi:MAG: tRNA-intron lyase [Methanoregulaceae archaeon]|nr:tRNA-intron lyase [Methanoregulaceae archaeon]